MGYADRSEPVEIVNLRLKLEIKVDKPEFVAEFTAGLDADSRVARIGESEVVYRDGPMVTPLYQREQLAAGSQISGPALIIQMDTTTVVPPGWAGTVDMFGNLVLEPV